MIHIISFIKVSEKEKTTISYHVDTNIDSDKVLIYCKILKEYKNPDTDKSY